MRVASLLGRILLALLVSGTGVFAQEVEPTPPAAAPAGAPPPTLPIWVDADPTATARVLSTLSADRSGRLDFVETPLDELADFVEDEYGLQILLDEMALSELGLSTDEPVSIDVSGVKLGVALRLLLRPLELTYRVENGVLVITSEDEALTRRITAIYPVAGIAEDWPQYERLVGLITSTVAVGSWAGDRDGEAEIIPYPWRGVLVVSQTTEAHEEIAALLAGLWRRPARDVPGPPPMPAATEHNAPEEAAEPSARGGFGFGGGGGGVF